jgi:hypothetical protein
MRHLLGDQKACFSMVIFKNLQTKIGNNYDSILIKRYLDDNQYKHLIISQKELLKNLDTGEQMVYIGYSFKGCI